MLGFLPKVVILLLLIVLLGFFNEKTTKFPYEISLMLFSIVISMIMLIFDSALRSTSISELLSNLQVFNLEALLMEGVLCFMLYAFCRFLSHAASGFQETRPPDYNAFCCCNTSGRDFLRFPVLCRCFSSGTTIQFSGMPDVRKHHSTNRSNRSNKYSEKIQSSKRYQFHHGRRISF